MRVGLIRFCDISPKMKKPLKNGAVCWGIEQYTFEYQKTYVLQGLKKTQENAFARKLQENFY